VNSKDANFLWLFSKQIQTGIVYDTKELGTKLTASTTFQSPFLVRTSPQHVHTAELSVNSTRMQIFVAVFKQIKLELFTISKEFETQPEPYYLQIQGGKKKGLQENTPCAHTVQLQKTICRHQPHFSILILGQN
jgi:hypothetical protein